MQVSDPRHRRSVRLKDYDYGSAGAYFITICTHHRRPTLANIEGEELRLQAIGRIVDEEWLRTGQLRRNVTLDEHIVMPNHFHAIIFIHDTTETPSSSHSLLRQDLGRGELHTPTPDDEPPPSKRETSGTNRHMPNHPSGTLGAIVRGFKAATTSQARKRGLLADVPLWQRNYYEHVIRSDEALRRIREYIPDNPRRWLEDRYFVD